MFHIFSSDCIALQKNKITKDMSNGNKGFNLCSSNFRSFKGHNVIDIKEYRIEQRIEIILEKKEDFIHLCSRGGSKMDNQHYRYYVRVNHLKVCGWDVAICF